MSAVLYRRSATENPRWLADQQASCEKYARDHSLTITNVVTEVGRTRDGLHRVVDSAEHDGVTDLIVTDLARLGRTLADHLSIMQRLQDAGVEVHVTQQRATNVHDRFLLAAMASYVEADTKLGYPLCGDDPLRDCPDD